MLFAGAHPGPFMAGPFIFLLLIIVLIVVAAVRGRKRRAQFMEMMQQAIPKKADADVLKALKLRFVEGEITEEEYKAMKEVLTEA